SNAPAGQRWDSKGGQGAGASAMYKQILVPLDGSELAEHVLPHVCDLAECSGAQVVLLRVPGEPAFDYLVPDGQVIVELRHDIEDAAKIYLEQVADEMRERGIRV